jgi:thioredoxin reductase (NADPH)
MAPIVVQGIQPGGQLTITTDVENYPGFRDVIQGPWLMQEMQAQAEHVGTRTMWDTIVEVDIAGGSPFRAIGDSGDEYIGDVLVIATGAQASGSACRARSGSAARASRPAPPATGSSTAARRSR